MNKMGLILKCQNCGIYNLTETCRECGGKCICVRPARYSPEDKYGKYRRMAKKGE
jgi:H/ACA ribonucleoprotein complex subunit 3